MSSAGAILDRVSTLGERSPRSSKLTYVRCTPARWASSSCVSPRARRAFAIVAASARRSEKRVSLWPVTLLRYSAADGPSSDNSMRDPRPTLERAVGWSPPAAGHAT